MDRNKKKRQAKDRRYYKRHRAAILKKKKEYGRKNKKAIAKRKQELYKKNRTKILAQRRKSNRKNRTKILKKAKEKRLKNRLFYKIKDHTYYLKNKKKIRERNNKYDKKHKKQLMKKAVKRQIERRKTDINFRLSCILRARLQKAIKGRIKKGSATRDLGCTVEFLKEYIESKFYGNMSWDNYGSYWELDHIEALWKFNLSNRNEFLEACHYTNLRPLTKKDHKKKTQQDMLEYRLAKI